MSKSVIHCVIDFFVKPQSADKVCNILAGILEASRKEDGCLKFKLFENIGDPCQFTFIGAWENEDAFEDYLQCDHFCKAETDIKGDLLKKTDIKRYKYIQTDPTKTADTKTSGFCILI
jgi:quinol monooxygenase YgiN